MVHQQVREGRADHRAAAKTHDCHAGGHAAAIREPFDQGGNRRDITKAKADTADDTRANPHQPELVGDDADCRENHAATPAQGRDDACLTRTGALEPATPDGRRAAKQDEEQRIDPAEVTDAPVAACREQGAQEIETGASGLLLRTDCP